MCAVPNQTIAPHSTKSTDSVYNMDSGHERTISPPEFKPAAFISQEESRTCGMVSVRDAMPTYVKELIAGGAAGGFAKTVVAPLERIKILRQTRYGNFQSLGVMRSLQFILNSEGILGLFKGNGASVIRVVPYAALHFMAYEQYRRWIIDHYPLASSGAAVDLLAGSVAGGTAVLCTYPLDLARTRLAYQVSDASRGISVYKGIGDVFSKVLKESGFKGLYRGVAIILCQNLILKPNLQSHRTKPWRSTRKLKILASKLHQCFWVLCPICFWQSQGKG